MKLPVMATPALWAAAVLLGCGGERPAPEPTVPQRIVAVAPSAAEIVFALGEGDRVVGVGDYAQWPPEVSTRTRVGGLFDVRLETVVSLEPDLVILLPSEERLAGQMEQLDVEVLTVEHESLADVEEAMRTIARRLEVEEVGEDLAARWREDLAPDPLASTPTVLVTVTREAGRLGDVLVAGEGTFYDELLRRLGVVNAFRGSPIPYPQVNAEEILRRQPHAILELQPRVLSTHAQQRLFSDWEALPDLPAAELDCVRVIAGDHVLLPGPRVTRLYRQLRRALLSCDSLAAAENAVAGAGP